MFCLLDSTQALSTKPACMSMGIGVHKESWTFNPRLSNGEQRSVSGSPRWRDGMVDEVNPKPCIALHTYS